MAAMVRMANQQHHFLQTNTAWSDYTGIASEELFADGWAAVHADDQQEVIDQLAVCLLQQAPFTIEYRLKARQGGYRWVRDTGIPHYTDQGICEGFVIVTTDIHAAKLAQHETFMQAQALDHVSDVIISTDLQFRVTVFNKAAEELYGIGAAHIMGRPIRDFIDHQYPECTREEALQVLYLKDSWKGLCFFDRPDGKRIFMDCSLAFIKDREGKRIGIAGIHRDITGQRKAEADRYRQEQLLILEKKVLEMNAQPGITLKTIADYFLEGIEGFFPGMLCSIITVDPDDGRLNHLSAPSIPTEFTGLIRKLKPGPSVGSCGTAIYRKQMVITTDIYTDPLWDGHHFLADNFKLRSCWSLPIINAQGEVLATIAAYHRVVKSPSEEELSLLERIRNLLRIIIENKFAEARIRASHERYLLVTRVTNDVVWDWDIVNDDNMHWGDGFYNLFGYRPALIRKTAGFWESCIHPDDRGRVVKELDAFITNNKARTWEDEYRFRKANGEYALVHDRGFLIFDHEGRITRMVGSMQDITEKRELERQLLKQELDKQIMVAQAVVNAQEKERADIGKDLHDNVNQILTTAKLYLEMVKHNDPTGAHLINRCSDSIAEAINEIRTISRSLVPASIGDLGLVVSIQDLVDNINATRQLKMEFECQGDVDATVQEKTKLMLFRIIQEQVNNVLKHAAATEAVISLNVGTTDIDLSVSDNGRGFEPEKVKVKKGVGLSNIASRVQLFNGSFQIQTAPEKGCTIYINVPL
ncbi:PAS domain-containing protein [Paraflavitalea sp. CAU 1676]|uniref:PAS domain-containing protein n=1 Tax=Paraflavitalea sp. CAU 1676 TaxID=3032598 RepID=UPI0023D983C4|nr:PAS domain-containing protein [Paraflavitalea sp. CAU 1676]MDF2186881.1 PAS domain-containing protein [Paraflavitalea sp. CAU 1676]